MRIKTLAVVGRPCVWTVLAASLLGCSEGTRSADEASAGSGGAAGSAGSSAGGKAGTAGSPSTVDVPACVTPERFSGSVDVPSPLVSVGQRVVGSPAVEGESTEARFPESAVDGVYASGTPCQLGVPTPEEPAWVAIELEPGLERVLLSWTTPSSGPFNQPSQGAPADYRIEISDDSSDGVDGTWEIVLEIEDNPVRSRAHVFDLAGKPWIKLVVTEAGKGTTNVRFDEIAVHDVTTSGDERPKDTWFFMGDSITQGAFTRGFGDENLEARLHRANAAFDPIVIGAGIGGEKASDGAAHVNDWLELAPDFEHVAILYGTNDAWGNNRPTTVSFERNLTTIVEAVLAAGRTPVLARIPYATAAHRTVPEFNAVIQDLTERYELPCGPDFYEYFAQHPEELQEDGVHLTAAGNRSFNRLWAEALMPLYAEE